LGLFLALGLVVVDWVEACGGGPVLEGMDDGVALVVGLVVGGGPRKGRKLPSLLEGPAFRPGAMVERKVQPEKVGV